MWVDTPDGKAYVPDRISHSHLVDVPDDCFPEFREHAERLERFIGESPLGDLAFRLLLCRDAASFSPRVMGRGVPFVYVNHPFTSFHIFESPEAFNYALAAQWSWERSSKPWTRRHLQAVHRRLLPQDVRRSRFRDSPTGLGPRGCTLEEAAVRLTPPERIDSCFASLQDFVASSKCTHRLATAAVIHFLLVAIHPFADGNGRTARAIFAPTLKALQLISLPCLFIGESLLMRWRAYYTQIEQAQRSGELIAWVRFFVSTLVSQLVASASFLVEACAVYRELVDGLETSVEAEGGARFAEAAMLSQTMRLSTISKLLGVESEAGAELVSKLSKCLGTRKIVHSSDPVYQFNRLHSILSL
jgi:Fic/DOC family